MTIAMTLLGAIATVACSTHTPARHAAIERPPSEEFGFGPRASNAGLYQAVLDAPEPIRVGRMQTMRLRVRGVDGAEVGNAEVSVDGGMPDHGHGLPTRPRVTAHRGEGVYDVEGIRFNMGGWWVVTFRIAAAAGTDSVVFHLDL
jgi:hypothetical protein